MTNADATVGTEAGIFFAPTTSAANSRGAAITGYQYGSNQIGLNFYVGYATGAATQAMAIGPTGNVGIGVTAPSQLLEVFAAGSPTLAIANANQQWGIQTRSDISNSFNIRNITNPANVFTITTAGNIGIGTATPSSLLTVNGVLTVANSSTGTGTTFNVGTTGFLTVITPGSFTFNASNGNSFQLEQAGTSRLTIATSGNVGIATTTPSLQFFTNGTAGGTSAYQVVSDARLKTNVQPIAGALDLVARLNPVSYDWRPPSERTVGKTLSLPTNERQIGFIAQEVEKVVPEAVTKPGNDADATYELKEDNLIPVLVAAIGEQQTEIEQLRASLAALKTAVQP